MGTGELGKWAWIVGLALYVLGGILGAFDVDALSGDFVVALAGVLAFLGGLLHLSSGDRTAFFVAAIAFAFASIGGDWFGIGFLTDLVGGIMAGGAAAAAAGAGGVLLMSIYEWVMP